MSSEIKAKEYFFAAFLNPFESPNRIAVPLGMESRERAQRIDDLDQLKNSGVPKYLKDQMKRIMVIVLIYIVSFATIVPLIVLIYIGKKTIKKVEEETTRLADQSELASNKALRGPIQAIFTPSDPAAVTSDDDV